MAQSFAIVMAGGSGTRFWPASRAGHPKQFLTLTGARESLLQATARRAAVLTAPERVIVVTGARHAITTREQLPWLAAHNLLLEPTGRNTSPCIAWAATVAFERDPDAVLAVLPADPYVADEAAFGAAVERALSAARTGMLVTIGVRPTRAETGYGYVEQGDEISAGVHEARAFVEKPDRARAESYLKSGKHLWNSGMFFFRAKDILAAIARHLPEVSAFAKAYAAADEHARDALVQERFPTLPSISIDYGVMEREQGLAVVPSSFGWDDVGSFGAAYELAHKDSEQNALFGDAVCEDSHGCYVSAPPGKLVALLGAQDLVVVDTEDALLVMPRDRAQDVRRIVDRLNQEGRKRHL